MAHTKTSGKHMTGTNIIFNVSILSYSSVSLLLNKNIKCFQFQEKMKPLEGETSTPKRDCQIFCFAVSPEKFATSNMNQQQSQLQQNKK